MMYVACFYMAHIISNHLRVNPRTIRSTISGKFRGTIDVMSKEHPISGGGRSFHITF